MSNMDKDKILKALKDKVYYAELPSKMYMSIMGSTLYIKLDRDGVIQNMQNDASAFEGWIFCLKAFFPYINVVIIDWEDPSFSPDEKVIRTQQKHYSRFLLRVIWFVDNYSWADVVESKKQRLHVLSKGSANLLLIIHFKKARTKALRVRPTRK